ncbi:metal-dependent transcriptional regulator [Kineosporia rhizophila]|uniref:metal-dependent transcriptional regulator n=1 Tax=Kineosporia rhizophila TaxID=84633 RepID=UPI001E638067|nr:metal-dependent transcriptional regulator [Kineosporia rhizophila]MCE0536517.1 metal-dependent transcriptional regulator [Kineosporia rhizophila]
MNDHDLVDTGEMYLKAVLELEEEGVAALRARLVERFGHSGPTVSQTVDRLRRDQLLDLGADRRITLTVTGRTTAGAVMRKHRLTEVFLQQVVGLEWPLLHTEACRWEHVVSDHTESLINKLLGHPRLSPYGNPIAAGQAGPVENLARLAASAGRTGSEHPARTIAWIGEPLQADPDALQELLDLGLTPGAAIAAPRAQAATVTLTRGDEHEVSLPERLARHLFVSTEAPGHPGPEPLGAELAGAGTAG